MTNRHTGLQAYSEVAGIIGMKSITPYWRWSCTDNDKQIQPPGSQPISMFQSITQETLTIPAGSHSIKLVDNFFWPTTATPA
jgi:hypothetical protein